MKRHYCIFDAMRELKNLLPKVSKMESAYFVSSDRDVYYVGFGYEGRTNIESMIEKAFYEWGYDIGIEGHGESYEVFEYVPSSRKENEPYTFKKSKPSLLSKNIVRRKMEVAGEPLVSYSLQ